MSEIAASTSVPDGFFVGRNGQLVPHGQDQYVAYGVCGGRRGTRVVESHTQMVQETAGVSNACGRGFDSVQQAQAWCDEYILAQHPRRIAQLRAEVDDLVHELVSARARS